MTEHQKVRHLERLACLVAAGVEGSDALIDHLIDERTRYSARIAELLELMEAAEDSDTFQRHYAEAHGLTVALLRDNESRLHPGSVVEVHLSFLPVLFSEN